MIPIGGNLKIPIKVTLKQLDSWLQYVRDSGYPVSQVAVNGVNITYHADAPGYGDLTPIADVVKFPAGRKAYIYIRLPLKPDIPPCPDCNNAPIIKDPYKRVETPPKGAEEIKALCQGKACENYYKDGEWFG